MGYGESNYNQCLMFLIENSILTLRQVSIISKRLKNERQCVYGTAGSYYRQVKQCRIKIRRIIYTIILLRVLQVVDTNVIISLEQLISKLDELVSLNNSESDISQAEYGKNDLLTMLNMLDGVISKLVKI
jgi:ribosomal protein S14